MEAGLHEDELDDINEKPISKVKSIEELRSHLIDDSLSDLNKAILLLKSSYEVQSIVGLKMLTNLLRYDKINCIQKVFPLIKEIGFENDSHRSLEFYETLKNSLLDSLSNQVILPKEFTAHFLDLINNKIYLLCDAINDYENISICQIYIELMLEIVKVLPESLVKTAIFDSIPHLKLQQISRRTREYLSVLLARCATKLNPQLVKQQLFPILLDLCNDTQYEVRASACQSLSIVCKALGQDSTINIVIPEMFKFLYDESSLVKISCFQSLTEILDMIDDFETKSYLLKKIQIFIDYGIQLKDELYLIKISEKLGSIVQSLSEIMNPQVKSSIIDAFYQICKNEALFSKRSINESKFNWCTCKINLANCFPSVLTICSASNFEHKLSDCFTFLVRDPNERVRAAAVSKIIEIAHKIDPSQYTLLINDYCSALNDQSPLVLNAAISQLDKFLNLFVKTANTNGILNDTQQMPSHQLVLKRILQAEQFISQSYKYSIHVQILESLCYLPWLISSEQLIEKILPLLESRLNSRALPVRLGASKALLSILRKIPRKDVRHYYYSKLIEFSIDKNCYKRIIFIEICKLILELYSKSFFKIHFYQALIKLAIDPVVNVRIAFVKIIVDLKKLWKLPNDREKLDNLEVIARNLFRDKDKDVFELAQKAISQMDLIKSYALNENENKFDRIKLEEENLLYSIEPKRPKTKPEISQTSSINRKSNVSRSTSKSTRPVNAFNKTIATSQPHTNQNNLNLDSRLFQQSMTHTSESGDDNKKRHQNSLSFSLISERPKPKPLQTRRNSINLSTEIISSSNTSNNSIQSKSFTNPSKKK